MGETPKPCDGLSGQCADAPEFRVSWRELGHRFRRRAKLCARCLHGLREKAVASDVVATQLGARRRPAPPASGRHRAGDDAADGT